MRDILANMRKKGQTAPAPDAPEREQTRRLGDAQQEAISTRLRKELLAREIQATIARLSR